MIAVARYYFDILDGAQSVRDDEGSDFDSLDAAVQAAARAAAEIGTDRLAKGDTRDVVIGVRDERGKRICTVKVRISRDGEHGFHRIVSTDFRGS